MKAFGEHLVQAREAAGLTLDDIHQRTRISRKNLLLLEAGDFPGIPQTYIRAFVREYARVVGLDEDETLEMYNTLAERDRGVPPPPSAIDSSNLTPRNDDSVEFVPASDRSSSPIEVDGRAEAADDSFVHRVRKSPYVTDSSAPPIDIRTTAKEKPAPPHPPSEKADGKKPTTPPAPSGESASHQPSSPSTKEHSAVDTGSKTQPSESQARDAERAATSATPTPQKSETTERARKGHESDNAGAASSPVEASEASERDTKIPSALMGKKSDAVADDSHKQAPQKEERPSRGKEKERRSRVYDTKPPIEEAGAKPRVRTEKEEDKRIIGIGLVIITMLVVAVYGVYYFSFRGGTEESLIDSTAIKASIEAGRFIDSTQAAITEFELPMDTVPALPRTPVEPVEVKQKVQTRDDSLLLEAFTTAPVWFSVKMDTLRTERGSLSSNEHRTWKAKDYFVITLGDAGAVTFFLNGREIGTLGEEGAVVKNVVLSRTRIRGD
jgi:hypothetical protein